MHQQDGTRFHQCIKMVYNLKICELFLGFWTTVVHMWLQLRTQNHSWGWALLAYMANRHMSVSTLQGTFTHSWVLWCVPVTLKVHQSCLSLNQLLESLILCVLSVSSISAQIFFYYYFLSSTGFNLFLFFQILELHQVTYLFVLFLIFLNIGR